MKKGRLRWLYLASFLVHAIAGVGLAVIPKKQLDEIVSVVLSDVMPTPEEAPPPPEPPPPAEPARAAAEAPRRAPRAARANPMPPSAGQMRAAQAAAANAQTASSEGSPGGTGFPDYGIQLGSDSAAGAGGIEVPSGPVGIGGLGDGRPRPIAVARTLAPARREPIARRAGPQGCEEEPTRPRAIHVPRPEYPSSARSAGVAGKVRVRLTIDPDGDVIDAQVLSGPGSGLHEAALTAARAARFEPSMRCGRAVQGSFTLGVRFAI